MAGSKLDYDYHAVSRDDQKFTSNSGCGVDRGQIAEENDQDSVSDASFTDKDRIDLKYAINDTPPWYMCFALGFQQYLTMFGATVALPIILSSALCIGEQDNLAKSELISTIFFVSGLSTLLQTTLGCRLPIVQGGTFTLLTPTFAILSLEQFKCPAAALGDDQLPTDAGPNGTLGNVSLVTSPLPEPVDWKFRMREVQGAIMISSLFEVVIGFSGLMGLVMRFIGPLTIGPAIALVGLSLFGAAADYAGIHWGISGMTIALILIFSQFMEGLGCPFPSIKGRRVGFQKVEIFKLFPVILAIVFAWLVCAILTIANVFPSDPKDPHFKARTDSRIDVLRQAEWFRFPYPGQWGTPTISIAGVFGMLAGILGSMIESVGDYYACSRLSGAPPPPTHAVNRGIGMEGLGCFIAGIFGSGNGTTSYSENIGAIGITKVGSLRVIQYGAMIMVVCGILGKFGALFTTIPDPIIGGVFFVMFGMITAVGISNLQFVNMNSGRNLFIAGFAILSGLVIPYWLGKHPDAIQTGVYELDQIITVLLRTNMFVGGVLGFILDNTVPGTDEERGLLRWRSQFNDSGSQGRVQVSTHVYDLPFGVGNYWRISKYIPFLPYYGDENITPNDFLNMKISNRETVV